MSKQLHSAILTLKTPAEVAKFLRDLLTEPEIAEFANRFQIAKSLWLKEGSYIAIAKKHGVSTTTVTRVAQWLHRGKGGYQLVLTRLFGPPRPASTRGELGEAGPEKKGWQYHIIVVIYCHENN